MCIKIEYSKKSEVRFEAAVKLEGVVGKRGVCVVEPRVPEPVSSEVLPGAS